MNLLDWLNNQSLYPKIYWKSQEEEIAAAGTLKEFEEIPQSIESNSRLYGYLSFFPTESTWNGFRPCHFILPKIEKRQKPEFCQPKIPFLNALSFSSHLPAYCDWENSVQRSLAQIEEGKLQKVVLARKSVYQSEYSINPFALLERLKISSPNATLFCFAPNEKQAFFGASPELLYKREGQIIHTDAIAGTVPRGTTEEEMMHLRKELLSSKKLRSEWLFVKEHIQNTLSPISNALELLQEDICTTSHLQHLRARYRAHLKSAFSEKLLLNLFHPTPAVCGLPKKESSHFLREEEPFARGLYAAPIGWISTDSAQFAVAIRSALIDDKQLNLFAGAGIVSGSDPQSEWEELDQKIATLSFLFMRS